MSEIEKYYNGEIIVDFEEETELEKKYNEVAELYSEAVKKKIEYRKEIERLNNIINELEKILNYDIDKSEEYMNKIRRSSLQQGDYPVHYYRAEWQKEKAIGYLDKLQELKGSDK